MILPIDDNEPFDLNLLHEAVRLGRDHPEQLTDSHLRHLATYSPGDAQRLLEKRAEAQRPRLVRMPGIPLPQPQPSGISKAAVEAIITGIGPVIKSRFEERDKRIAALERQVKTLTDELVALQAHYALSETD